MSAIFGILRFDGAPVSPETLCHMRSAMSDWQADKDSIWCSGPIGLGSRLRYNTPEALHETLPLYDPQSKLVLTAGARIDNRTALFDILSIPHPERRQMPDGMLILKAFKKWGPNCADYLLGDWAFAVWDAAQHRLFLGRDHHGNTSLYYYQDLQFLAFSSALKGLLALPEIPRHPDELHLAARGESRG